MSNSIQTFVAGLITIGIITALVLPGRQTASLIKAAGGVLQGSLRTTISGK